jgi:MFS transporter, SP family, arabinose:H+ symporter
MTLRAASPGKSRIVSIRLMVAAGVCSLGGLTFGYDLGALSSAIQSIRDQFTLSPASFGLTISISLWGTICGSLLAGTVANRIGPRGLIKVSSNLYASAVIATLLLPAHWSLLLTLRFLSGGAIGGFTVGCPLYLAELAPNALRGRFVSLFQFQVGAGIVFGFAAGSLFAHATLPGAYWKWCFLLGAVPPISLLSLQRWMPEGPRWLGRKGDWHRAQATARWLGLSRLHRQEIANGLTLLGPTEQTSLFSRKYAKPIFLAMSVAIFNQLTGANVLLFYLLDVLSSAGIAHLPGNICAVVITSLNLGSTLLGMFCVDRLGRRPLLVCGSIAMALCLIGLCLAIPLHLKPVWYLIILATYNAFFAISQGTVIWVYLSELFPPAVRAPGQAFGSAVLWIATAVLIGVFPIFQSSSSVGIFYFFAAMMVLQAAVVWLWYPETKGVALGDTSGEVGYL